MSEWINVNDGKPKHSNIVLMGIAYKNSRSNWCRGYYKDGKWHQRLGGGFSEYGLLNITHWMEIEEIPWMKETPRRTEDE